MDTATANENELTVNEPTPPPPPIGAVIRTRKLPCRLTLEERARYGSMLADKLSEIERLDEERKVKAAEYSASIKAVEAEMSRISAAVGAKEELRPVDTYEVFVSGTMQTVRMDTKRVVSVRPATESERQLSIPGAAPPEPQPENGAPDFPSIEDGPRGAELAAPDGEDDDQGAAADGDDQGDGEPAVEIFDTQFGDKVALMPDDPEPAPFEDDKGDEDEDDGPGDDLDDDLDADRPKRPGPELKVSHSPVTGGEVHSLEIKHGKKRGPKGPRKPKADARVEEQAATPAAKPGPDKVRGRK